MFKNIFDAIFPKAKQEDYIDVCFLCKGNIGHDPVRFVAAVDGDFIEVVVCDDCYNKIPKDRFNDEAL